MSIKIEHKKEFVDEVLREEMYVVKKSWGTTGADWYYFTPKELLELKAELEKIKLEHE